MPRQRRKYYSLFEKLPGEQWAPQFGDYGRQVVVQERDDRKASGEYVRGTQYCIVETAPDQNSITMAGNTLNGIVIPDEQVLEDRVPA